MGINFHAKNKRAESYGLTLIPSSVRIPFMAGTDTIVIHGISFKGHCGITEEERNNAQPILIDLDLECRMDEAIRGEDISKTVDYADVTACVVREALSRQFVLIEALADHICQVLFREFPIQRMTIWARKVAAPISHVVSSVGVRFVRERPKSIFSQGTRLPPPADFLVEHLHRLPKGRALDVATGRGRNALFLASQGFDVLGIDRDSEALAFVESTARAQQLSHVAVQQADLEADSHHTPDLGTERYNVILVFFYLFRPLFPSLLRALKPRGMLMYETFLIDNHLQYNHPRRREFCLEHNELLPLTQGLRILHYDEGSHLTTPDNQPTFTARLLAQKPPLSQF